ncbi:SMI1/KNR4 family protein [Argonema antarcticum]|uniref:SMI1/KNR4 family protein n=1 Tax=Argonema antarcticum TaxID=2942763 RepID=UPI002011243F|nr:SMI1/KNR4 family protein [Argonema antarcticum]MCL1471808.1 SMI1/KNR4 family protein [Argonema antarcticum A004/B2]
MNKFEELKNKLTQLATTDKNFKNFGSETHKYQLNPCLTEAEIQAFEVKNKIALPDDYRNFLLEVGNGGAGPGYGLRKLEVKKEMSRGENDNYFSQPFLLKKAWNYPGLLNPGEEFVDIDEDKLTQGTISVANYGCGIYARLVITGDQRGTIWIDDRGNDGGIYPCSLQIASFYHSEMIEDEDLEPALREPPLSFYDWYDNWLNSSQILSLQGLAGE